MIRTDKKTKLPKGFAYPLGAERISDALAGIPQIASTVLTFEWRDEFWVSSWRERIKSLGTVTLIRASYWDRYDEWRLLAYAVPREFNVSARQHLLSGGLQELSMALRGAYGNSEQFNHDIKFSLSASKTS